MKTSLTDMDLAEKMAENWRRKAFPPSGILLAMSGGRDSMVLAHLLLKNAIPFAAGHCNFCLRGEDAVGDERFVSDWCAEHNIPFQSIRFDTLAIAETMKKGIQETARNLRYGWLETIRQSGKFSAIATAHHADDNAETMLMHLCRGTGIAGLHGIRERNGHIIRPLLFTPGAAIAQYAAGHSIEWREDASNAGDDYLRNALRHHVLPALEQWMPGAAERMYETAGRVGEAEEMYRKGIEAERKKLVQLRGKDCYIPVRLLRQRKPLFTICYELLKPFGFAASQTEAVLKLMDSESGKEISSGSHRVIRYGDFLIVTALPAQDADFIHIENASQMVEMSSVIFQLSVVNNLGKITNDASMAFLDLKSITFPLVLRRRREGDYFYPLGMGMKKKKVGRFLTDLKLPAHQKEQVWILESAQRIVWVCGHRIDERFKVTDATEKVLRIQLR